MQYNSWVDNFGKEKAEDFGSPTLLPELFKHLA